MFKNRQTKPAASDRSGMSVLEKLYTSRNPIERKLAVDGAATIVGEALKTLSADYGKILKQNGKDALNGEALAHLEKSQRVVAEACRLTGIRNIDISVVTGIQGAGKGTNDDAKKMAAAEFMKRNDFAQLPHELQEYIKANAGGVGLVKTGTGGISSYPDDPKNEYNQLFGKSGFKELAKDGVFTPDNAMTVICNLMLAKRIFEAAKENPGTDSIVVQFDLWPRTDGQVVHAQELINLLGTRDIKAKLAVLDLKLLKEEKMDGFMQNRQRVAEFSPRMVEILNKQLKPYVEDLDPKLSKVEVFQAMKAFLIGRVDEDNPIGLEYWIRELALSIDRAVARLRPDDDPKAIIKRWASSVSSGKFILGLEQYKAVATDQTPAEVVRDVILVETGLSAENRYVNEYVLRAGVIAEEIVAKAKASK